MDVYYWPVSGAKEDCVLTIGSEFNNPVTELLITDDRGYPYWKAQTNPWGQNGSLEVDSITLPPQQALAGAPNPLSGQTNIIKAREYWQNNITVPSNFSSSVAIATIGDFRWYDPPVLDRGKYIDYFSVPPHPFASASATFTRPMHVGRCQLTVS